MTENNPSDPAESSGTLELVGEVLELTGAAAPSLLSEDAPTLADAVVDQRGGDELYIVGLIGGKDVGKSALVNALVGREITPRTSHGPGTDTVIAYCHESQQTGLRRLLDSEVPGQYRIIAHTNNRLARQVLLDLPDIDSHFAHHIDLTRRMLRHMLFPIWVQSVEKYADAQPQRLLARVAQGNDPSNFLFCVNKVDQLEKPGDVQPQGENGAFSVASLELRDDYAARMARVLSLPKAPRVYLIAATQPERFDLPELAAVLGQQKTKAIVDESRQRAGRRRERSLLDWLDSQDLAGQAQRIGRLQEEAEELLSQRIGQPLLEQAVPALLEDPAYRMAMTDGVFAARVARWPLVNLVHALLSPLTYVVRENTAAGGSAHNAQALVQANLSGGGTDVAALVQSAFAQLHQTHPSLSQLYRGRKLWENMPAEAASSDLAAALAATVHRQREQVYARLAGRRGLISPLIRWLLTIGAALWFPVVQPILAASLEPSASRSLRDVGLLAVQILGVTPLLQSAAFLLIYYLALWAWLRWDTHRRVTRLLNRWKTVEHADPSVNLTTQTLQWLDGLLAPIRSSRQKLDDLVHRAGELRKSLTAHESAAA